LAALWRLRWRRVTFPLSRRHISIAVGFGFSRHRGAGCRLVTRTGDSSKTLLLVSVLQLKANIVAWRVFDFTRYLGSPCLSLSKNSNLSLVLHLSNYPCSYEIIWKFVNFIARRLLLTCSPWCPSSAKEPCRRTVIDQMKW